MTVRIITGSALDVLKRAGHVDEDCITIWDALDELADQGWDVRVTRPFLGLIEGGASCEGAE